VRHGCGLVAHSVVIGGWIYALGVLNSLVSDPATVEAKGDPGRQVNACDRLGGEVLGGKDD
jgi:hypothetical protein